MWVGVTVAGGSGVAVLGSDVGVGMTCEAARRLHPVIAVITSRQMAGMAKAFTMIFLWHEGAVFCTMMVFLCCHSVIDKILN